MVPYMFLVLSLKVAPDLYFPKQTYTQLFIATLLRIAPNWKQLRCSLTNETNGGTSTPKNTTAAIEKNELLSLIKKIGDL